MPQQNECLSFSPNVFVSHIDYSEAQNVLDLTTTKQKQLRRQRSQVLYKQVLLNRTYALCPHNDNEMKPLAKKSKSLMDKCYDITNDSDVLQFLRELNSVKLTSSSIHMNFSTVDDHDTAIVIYMM
ncbi:unnamed protein product [Adineta ricciae]|uniref:Uncharacterized protein n=1 Tax=Adineta ricciae TaxID=249248 RepID=A0A815K3P5_ADIRI|nr:unnamed protein product [Adineta ricciae]